MAKNFSAEYVHTRTRFNKPYNLVRTYVPTMTLIAISPMPLNQTDSPLDSKQPGPNHTTSSYNASVVKIYNATNSIIARFLE
jgi:hypothetical protein